MIRSISQKNYSGRQVLTVLTVMALSISVFTHAVDIPNLFQSGDTARAADVNQNFQVIADAIEALELDLATERSQREALEERIEDLESQSNVSNPLFDFVRIEDGELEGMRGPHIVFEGANVHIRSGSDFTDDDISSGQEPLGLGNLIIGYNESPQNLTDGERGGSHNLVLGERNRYSSVAGIVAGSDNEISAPSAMTVGGQFNRATGSFAVILGGGGATANLENVASGSYATITAGFRNVASGNQSSVSGGSNHRASGFLTSITGGTSNQAIGAGSTVSGGAGNIANGANSAISGGQGGRTEGVSSAISGGLDQTVNNNFDWRACNVTCN